MTAAARSPRHALLGQVHAAAKSAGLDDDTYRDRLFRAFGHRSARDCTDDQLREAVTMFHVKQNANNSYTAKLVALYLAAANLGAFDDMRDAAINAFVQRQTGKERLGFLTPSEANSVSEALKAICSCHGFVVPADDAGGLKARQELLKAQWKRLGDLGELRVPHGAALDSFVTKKFLTHTGSVIHMKPAQLDACAKIFGRWIRSAQKKKASEG